jgi:SAM-dependent methyltransferase
MKVSKKDLCCAVCSSDLTLINNKLLVCDNQFCKEEYPILDSGIPVIIDEKGSVFNKSDFVNQSETFFKKSYHNKWRSFAKKIAPEISHNIAAKENLQLFANQLLSKNKNPKVLVIGGGIKGEGFEVFQNFPSIEIIASDVSLGPETQIIADAHALPFASEVFDGVIVQAVLEHVLNPNQCINEIFRVLKAEGLVYAETPFMQQVHGGAYDFTRFTKLGHRWLFRDFTEIKSGAVCGPGMALAWSYQYFLCSFSAHPIFQIVAKSMARVTGFWLKYFDYLLKESKREKFGASAFYFLGKKSETPLSEKEIINLF